jgi:RNA polymerase sigma-70 factor (ECF subfamily)
MPTLASALPANSESALDALLVRRFNSGDESAFSEIVARYRDRIFVIANGLLRNRADAEEITQDAFVRAYRGLARFRGDSSLATWLHRITVNLARNRYWYFFRRRRHASISLDLPVGEDGAGSFADLIAADDPDPAQESVRGEFTALVAGCMAKLDEAQREILSMRTVQNLPYEEISARLCLNVGTVKSRIARARESLRRLLAESYPDLATTETAADCFLAKGSRYGLPARA